MFMYIRHEYKFTKGIACSGCCAGKHFLALPSHLIQLCDMTLFTFAMTHSYEEYDTACTRDFCDT